MDADFYIIILICFHKSVIANRYGRYVLAWMYCAVAWKAQVRKLREAKLSAIRAILQPHWTFLHERADHVQLFIKTVTFLTFHFFLSPFFLCFNRTGNKSLSLQATFLIFISSVHFLKLKTNMCHISWKLCAKLLAYCNFFLSLQNYQAWRESKIS